MNNTTSLPTVNSTSNANISQTVGLIACLISSVGYGINFLPVKKYEAGDGMFFQWIVSNAIFIGSFVANCYLKFPKFEPLVMLGGFIWSTGNICVVPIIKSIGLGLGLLIWGSTSIIFGWASCRFGWFGIDPQVPKSLSLNYIGFSLIAISPLLYSLVQSNVAPVVVKNETEFEITPQDEIPINIEYPIVRVVKLSLRSKSKIMGIALSIISGFLYGFHFLPVMYVKNRYANSSQQDIHYVFAQCSGIYLGSSLYFILYCFVKCNSPILYPKVILPAFLSGLIWIVSYIAYFIANEPLSPAITQPMVAALSGVISTLITVLVFKEVKGVRNYVIILVAIIIAITGSTLIGLSKVI